MRSPDEQPPLHTRMSRPSPSHFPQQTVAWPFLKWAGGKTQLLSAILSMLPSGIKDGKITRYMEPFIGGGAVFFALASKFPALEFYISDINEDLITAYRSIGCDVDSVVNCLQIMESRYHHMPHETRREYYYEVRDIFNTRQSVGPVRTAQLIFLNRSCFNGLYRVNSRGEFNVPHGRYARPLICDEVNLRAAARILSMTNIEVADFETASSRADAKTFVYLDPPYRPINDTSKFTTYSSGGFRETDHRRLAKAYKRLSSGGVYLMLSSAMNGEDEFSEFNVHRVNARRNINSKADKRGAITECLVTNY